MYLFKNIIFILLLLLVNYINGQTSVTASVDINRISQSETIGFKILTVNVDGTPNVDISPIVVFLLLWFVQNLLIEYWPRTL